ncbi:MAG: hypothetical protein PHR69_04215 [Sphaerochaeta sp.]|nr:hypothetical protein [Sphaerochaeta sp.]
MALFLIKSRQLSMPVDTEYFPCKENGEFWQVELFEAGESMGLGFVMTSLDNLNMKLWPLQVKS